MKINEIKQFIQPRQGSSSLLNKISQLVSVANHMKMVSFNETKKPVLLQWVK